MTESSGLVIAGELLAVLVLVLANGFFVAAEFSLVAIRRSRVEQLVEERRARANELLNAVIHLDAYLAATQLGVTMSSLGLGWLGEPAIAHLIEPTLEQILSKNLALIGAHTISVVIAFTIITALHIVLGELTPKSLAIQRPEDTSLFVIKPLGIYLAIFRPAVEFLNNLGNLVLRLLGLEPGSGEMLVHSPEEFKLLLAASRQAGLVGEAEESMVDRIFRLGEQRIGSFMTPRLDIIPLDIEEPISTLEEKIIASSESYFIVCQGELDHLLGFISAKDFLAANRLQTLTVSRLVEQLARPLYLPENIATLNAISLLKESGTSIAAVVDEYGAIQGLVTINDILEAIVGDLHSSNASGQQMAIHCQDGSWLLDSRLSIEEFRDIFKIRKLSDEDDAGYQTLSGFVLTQLGHIPTVSETFEWEDLHIQVVSMNGNRLGKVLVTPATERSHPQRHNGKDHGS